LIGLRAKKSERAPVPVDETCHGVNVASISALLPDSPVLRETAATESLRRLGGRTRARTWDPMIKSHLLYQLSYAPGS
jgi:hypothetical protein